jgi:hypothetical protein
VNRRVLETIFRLKGNFAPGIVPSEKTFDGVAIAPFRDNAPAAVTISADFELSWALRGRSPQERARRAARCRANVPFLLSMFAELDIPITWATVGHLFLTRCDREDDRLPHPEMPRPPVNRRWSGDWYAHDPCAGVAEAPGWYAPDLIHAIMAGPTMHELGSHSFSHIDFSQSTSTRRLVEQELAECVRVMEPFGIRPKSLVYPFNRMGHHYLDVIAEAGITSVRHRDARVRLSYPERSETGVYKLYESMNLRKGNHYEYSEKAVVFLAEAMTRHAAYHIWFHPSDPKELFENELRAVLCHVARLRRDGKATVATMQELAAYCEARHQTRLQVGREGDRLRITVLTRYDQARYGDTELTLELPSGGLLNVPAKPGEVEVAL